MANKVITGAIAIIKVNGQAIGKMRGITVNENMTRGDVKGIGEIVSKERPVLSWAGTLSCDFYNIDFSISQIPEAIWRNVQSIQQFIDSVVLQEDGVQVDIYQKIPAEGSPTIGIIEADEKPYCSVKGLYLDTESFNINEGQISGRSQTFTYIYPIIFPQ